MTHVATAVINISNHRHTPVVATNRATELRIQKLRNNTTQKEVEEKKPPTTQIKRTYSFNPQSKQINHNLRSRVDIFENNKENKDIVNKTKLIRRNEIQKISQNNNSTEVIEIKKEHNITINSNITKTLPHVNNGYIGKPNEPEIITLESLNVTKSVAKFEQKNVNNKEERKEFRRYQTIDVPIRPPVINISVSPWAGSKHFVTTDEDNKEVEKILAERRKKIEESIKKEEEAEEVDKNVEEEVVELRPISLNPVDETLRESAGDSLDVNYPKAIDLARHQQRPLWRDVKGIQEAGILETLTKDGRVRQEAKFELMLSEGTYLHSLNILKGHYMSNIRKHVPQVISDKDYDTLFKNVLDIHTCSEAFLQDIDDVWQDDPMLNGIYQVIINHAGEHFGAYKKYCRNMLDMSKHLTELITSKESFRNLLEVLINREGSQRLTLDSFLTAPMQRITKLPLLMKTILDKIEDGTEEHALCSAAYEATAKIAGDCDEVVTEKKRLEELLKLSHELEISEDTKNIPIVIPNRTLVSRANVKHFAFRDKAPKREKLQLILFSDYLLVTKRKSEKHFIVVDHCRRERVVLKEMENTTLYGQGETTNQLKPVVITMLSNHQDKKIDLVITFKDQNQCKEWLQLFAVEEDDDESYDQAIALQEHIAEGSDELNLSPGDVVKITGSEIEGWCEGEILLDGTKGRFPIAKTTKITSSRAKAANIKAKKELRSSKNMEDNVSKSDDESAIKAKKELRSSKNMDENVIKSEDESVIKEADALTNEDTEDTNNQPTLLL